MSDIVLRIEGLEFHADGRDDEPRILDLDVARRAGMKRPRDVRKVIKGAIEDGAFRFGEHYQAVFPRAVSERAANKAEIRMLAEVEYWLTQAGSLKLVTRLRTDAADQAVDQMIRVYLEARRQLREPAPVTAPALTGRPEDVARDWAAKLPHLTLVRDNPIWAHGLKFQIGYVALRQGLSWRAVEGWLRKSFGAVSYLQIPVIVFDAARRLLEQAGIGDVVIARRIEALPGDQRQQKLFPDNDPKNRPN